ncbi:MAG: hypothetical protein ACLVIY_06085 [Anaerobutyricum soehngenii]
MSLILCWMCPDMSADVSNIFSMFNNADIRFPSIEGKRRRKI